MTNKDALTQKQKAAVAKAPQARKAALTQTFKKQNHMQSSPLIPVINKFQKSAKPQLPLGLAKVTTKSGPPKKVKNLLDPMNRVPVPTIVSEGNALPHTALVSHDFKVGGPVSAGDNTPNTNKTVLLCTNTGRGGTVGVLFKVNESGFLVSGSPEILTIPTLASASPSGGPTGIRAMKLSVSVVNCSNALVCGGRITYLNSSQRLPREIVGEDGGKKYQDLIDAVKTAPARRRIQGIDLVKPKHLIAYPVDQSEYISFNDSEGTQSMKNFLRSVVTAGAGEGNEVFRRPMSTIAFVFEPVAAEQDYSVTIRASFYTRWPLLTVPGQSMIAIPTAHADKINNHRDAAEAQANDLLHIAEGAIGANVVPRAMKTVGNALTRGLGMAAEAAETQAAGMIEGGVAQVAEDALITLL